jgi:hypothetical protein
MVPLTEADNEFEARVLVAKLGSAGIIAEVRGVGSIYPILGSPEVWVEQQEWADARELITADLDDAFAAEPAPAGHPSMATRWLRPVLVAVSLLLLGSIAFGARCSPTPSAPAAHTR